MHYLCYLLPALTVAASIDASALHQKPDRRHQNAAPPSSCPSPGVPAVREPAVSEPAPAVISPGADARAIYFQTNQDSNSIIMLPVQDDGMLAAAGSIFATGGKGAILVDQTSGQPSVTDALASAGSVRVVGSSLFVVNAGSNTLSMFAIDPQDPAQLSVVGQPVETGGDFPTSIAVSDSLKTVCVGHSGVLAGITCAKFDPISGISAFDDLRPFCLGQTDPPTGPDNGIGTTFFNPDSTSLITTVKGNPTDPSGAQPGFVSIFSVDEASGTVSRTDKRTTPPGTALLFGSIPIPGTRNSILSADASFGSITLNLDSLTDSSSPPSSSSDDSIVIARTIVPGQVVTCWSAISPVTGTGFISDGGLARLVEVDLQTGAALTILPVQNSSHFGLLDLQATPAGMIYALAPGNGTDDASVLVFKVTGRGQVREVQDLPVPGLTFSGVGMAFYL